MGTKEARNMGINEIIQRYLQIVLTWQVVFIILAFMFRKSIREFLGRITKGEGYGFRLEAGTAVEQQKEVKKDISQTEDEIEAYVKDHPKEAIIEYKKVLNSYWFERIYNMIYGTQITLLEYLLDKKSNGDVYINLVSYYNEFVKRSRLYNVQMANYLGFLKAMNLIEYQGEGNNLIVKITPYGLDFLSYIKGQYQSAYRYKAF